MQGFALAQDAGCLRSLDKRNHGRTVPGFLTKYSECMTPEEQIRFELEAAIVSEVTPREKSKYHLGHHGPCANLKDFDTKRMVEVFSNEFPAVPKEKIQGILMQAIYFYYLR
jgi:hypothetical protein